MKHATILWKILNIAIWTGRKAKERGKGDGRCMRCHHPDKDLLHLFYECKFNTKYLQLLQNCCGNQLSTPLTWKEILPGECRGLDVMYWNKIKSLVLYAIWKDRNSAVYAKSLNSSRYSTSLLSTLSSNSKMCSTMAGIRLRALRIFPDNNGRESSLLHTVPLD